VIPRAPKHDKNRQTQPDPLMIQPQRLATVMTPFPVRTNATPARQFCDSPTRSATLSVCDSERIFWSTRKIAA